MLSDLTYKMVAFGDFKEPNGDESVDWAIEMLQAGFETPSLLIIAGLSKPTDYFEIKDYLKKALKELNLNEKTGIEATVSYSSYYILKIAKGENVKRNLSFVFEICCERQYEKVIYDFYLLYHAWQNLDYGELYQNYWPEVNKNNIEQVVVDVSNKWIVENKDHYKQPYL